MDRGTPPRRNRPAPAAQSSRPQTTANATPRPRRRPHHPRSPHHARPNPPSSSSATNASSAVAAAGRAPTAAAAAVAAAATASPRSRPPRTKNRQRRRGAPQPPPLAYKLIVRRLPPTLHPDQFAALADQHGATTAVWRSYFPGSVEATGSVKRTAHIVRHSVAYLSFGNMDDATAFHRSFNGHVFSDPATAAAAPKPLNASGQYVASVERALCQTTPVVRRRAPLPMQNTIDQDPDYLAFLKTLDGADMLPTAPSPKSTSSPSNSASASSPSEKEAVRSPEDSKKVKGSPKSQIITPLMEAVRSRRKERDQKKKTSKLIVRPPRVKGRQVRVVDAPKAIVESSKARRKKRRGAEGSASDRKADDSNVTDRRNPSGKPTPSFVRRDHGNAKGGASSAHGKASSYMKHANADPSEPSESSGKSDARGSGGRNRYGRGSRARGNKYNGTANGVLGNSATNDHAARTDNLHGTVRLLKKEASNASKT